MASNSIIDNIKETILGVKSSKIDSLIDASLDSISRYSSNSDTNKYLETMKDLIKTTSSNNKTADDVLGQLQRGMPQVQTYDQSGRVARYSEYEAICNKISYVQKAIDVLTDHIIAPDDILKYSLSIIPEDTDRKDAEVSKAITRLKNLAKQFKFEQKVKHLVKDTLKFGDYFVEIVPTPKGKNALVVVNEDFDYSALNDSNVLVEKTNFVLESRKPYFDFNSREEKLTDPERKSFSIVVDESSLGMDDNHKPMIINESYTSMYQLAGSSFLGPTLVGPNIASTLPVNMEPISKDKTPTDSVDADKFKSKYSDPDNVKLVKDEDGQTRLDIKDINLVFHEPKYIIRLETERFKVCLGYLVFPKVDPATMMNTGVNTNIDSICANLLKKIQQKLSGRDSLYKNDDIKISDDIKKVLLAHLQKIDNNDDLKIRYVAPEFMEHFRINVSRYAPYGESILDSSVYDAKLLMALKTAAAIKKINACSDKRFVNVEVGLPRDAKTIVQKMEEALTKKRISVNSMGNIDSIPSQISTFESIFLPMKDGKKFVEIDHQNWGGDTSNDTDNQKTMRDAIVGNLGVPAPYLNIEENSSNRSILTVESINFCRTVIGHQKEFSPFLWELFAKIYILVYGKEDTDILTKVKITFNQPKGLPNSSAAEIMEGTQRLIDSLSNMGYPKKLLVKKYLPELDQEMIEIASAQEKLDLETGEAQQQNGMDMMGGGMGGMPMGGGMGF